MIDIELLKASIPALLKGAQATITLAAGSCVIGLGFGLLIALAQTSKSTILKTLVHIYITIIRGTPMLIQIAFMYYGILPLIGLALSPFWTALIAIGLNSAAYVSQVLKSGILSIGKGQLEAAKVLGLTQMQTVRYIIVPQALRAVLPALGNEFITLIKDSSLASTIGVVELFKEGSIIISQTYDALTVYVGVALTYLVLTSTLSAIVYRLERKFN